MSIDITKYLRERSRDDDCASIKHTMRKAADEIDRLRAALAAAQAAGVDNKDRKLVRATIRLAETSGFEAAIEAAIEEIKANKPGLLNRLRALSPPASAETESEVMQNQDKLLRSECGPQTPPLSASAPAGAPSEEDMAQIIKKLKGRPKEQGYQTLYAEGWIQALVGLEAALDDWKREKRTTQTKE